MQFFFRPNLKMIVCTLSSACRNPLTAGTAAEEYKTTLNFLPQSGEQLIALEYGKTLQRSKCKTSRSQEFSNFREAQTAN